VGQNAGCALMRKHARVWEAMESKMPAPHGMAHPESGFWGGHAYLNSTLDRCQRY
jgi:hypothetical protein